MRTRRKDSICFSKRYRKLSLPEFDTVRWLDSVYVLGQVYPCLFVAQNAWHGHYPLGSYRITSLRIAKLVDLLNEEFTFADADCDTDTYYGVMLKWYGQKPDWRGFDSEVQVIRLVKVASSIEYIHQGGPRQPATMSTAVATGDPLPARKDGTNHVPLFHVPSKIRERKGD